MSPDNFDFLAKIIKQRSGLVLTREKAYLIEARLPAVTRKYNLKTIEDLVQAIRNKSDEAMLNDIAEAMTTNESYFFRDQKPFDQFRQVLLSRFLQSRSAKKHIRIWSAAASSGQEAYSLAIICAEESARLQGWKIDIFGTDLSHEMIDRARQGIYSQFEVQRGLPITLLVKYFQKAGEKWQIKEPLRQMVRFQTANLLRDPGPIGVFDIILCRNVLFYFDALAKTQVLGMMANIIEPDGVLYLGGTETVLGVTDKFKPMDGERGLYVPSKTK